MADELLGIGNRLVRDADGERVRFLGRFLRVLAWARSESYAGAFVIIFFLLLLSFLSGPG